MSRVYHFLSRTFKDRDASVKVAEAILLPMGLEVVFTQFHPAQFNPSGTFRRDGILVFKLNREMSEDEMWAIENDHNVMIFGDM